MTPYEIVRKKLTKDGNEWRIAPEPPTPEMRTWTGHLAFVPGTPSDIRKKIDGVPISFSADVLAVDGGAWIWAGFSDLEKIVKAIR